MSAAFSGVRRLELGGRSFYCRDGLLEIWLAVMVDEVASSGGHERWMHMLSDDLRAQATVVFEGLLSARLDPHLTSAGRLELFAELCGKARTRLAERGFVPGKLAAQVGKERWDADMPARVARVADAVMWLLTEARRDALS